MDISFFLLVCWDPVWYKWHRQGLYHLWKLSQMEVEFLHVSEGHPGEFRSVVQLMDSYKSVLGLFNFVQPVLSSLGVVP